MGLSDLPLKSLSLLINTNYNFSSGNSASQAQFLQVYYSEPELSGLVAQRDTVDRDAMQMYLRKEKYILGGLDIRILILPGMKCVFLRATLTYTALERTIKHYALGHELTSSPSQESIFLCPYMLLSPYMQRHNLLYIHSE